MVLFLSEALNYELVVVECVGAFQSAGIRNEHLNMIFEEYGKLLGIFLSQWKIFQLSKPLVGTHNGREGIKILSRFIERNNVVFHAKDRAKYYFIYGGGIQDSVSICSLSYTVIRTLAFLA